jgi:hypothetical protein
MILDNKVIEYEIPLMILENKIIDDKVNIPLIFYILQIWNRPGARSLTPAISAVPPGVATAPMR